MSAIKLENVTKSYRRRHLGALKIMRGVIDISFEVREGEIFGLLGLNGSGKTTTIKLILGLLFPNKGRISVFDQPMPNLDILGQIGYLPEVAYLYKYLSGREVLDIFASLSNIPNREKEARVMQIIDRVGLKNVKDKRLKEYSKGMLQRTAMAQALLHDPRLLVLDEPITGLDPLALKEVRQLILWLKSKGKTVFFSSHHISEVERVCDRVGILVKGELVRIIEQKEWKGGEGVLEEIFVETVKGSEEVGAITLAREGK